MPTIKWAAETKRKRETEREREKYRRRNVGNALI